jgi:hypothetical protein
LVAVLEAEPDFALESELDDGVDAPLDAALDDVLESDPDVERASDPDEEPEFELEAAGVEAEAGDFALAPLPRLSFL